MMEYIIERDCGSAFCFSKHSIKVKAKGDMAAREKLKKMQEEAVARQSLFYPVKVRKKGGRKYL